MGPSHDKAVAQQTQAKKPNISHEEERIALILFLTGGFVIWNIFRAELKSGFQSLIINEIEIVMGLLCDPVPSGPMCDEKTNPKLGNFVLN